MLNFKAEDISFLNDSWESFTDFLNENSQRQFFVLVDSNTNVSCMPILSALLDEKQVQYSVLEVEAGEISKSLEVCASLWSALTEDMGTRQSILLNLGGGMICDLGGFVATVYKRGIDFVNIPTSLLGMVDAAIGGKCGIDFNGFKNQLGVFKTAVKTFIYPDFLKTLPLNELRSGYAEMSKHALIEDKEHWNELLNHNFNTPPTEAILKRSIAVKTEIVLADPLEKNERKRLNFGHTFGHAIESYFLEQDEPIPHGFAIAAGIICEAKLSTDLMFLSESSFSAIVEAIDRNYQRLKIGEESHAELITLMKQDKKNTGSQINCTLLNDVGSSVINQNIGEEALLAALKFYFQA